MFKIGNKIRFKADTSIDSVKKMIKVSSDCLDSQKSLKMDDHHDETYEPTVQSDVIEIDWDSLNRVNSLAKTRLWRNTVVSVHIFLK